MKKLLLGLLVFMLMLGIGITFSSCSGKKSAIEGYEWLEGEWEGVAPNGDWGKIIITQKKYKIVYSFTNKSLDEIDYVESRPITISKVDNYIVGDEILALDKKNSVIGIDASEEKVYIILGEYNSLYLEKKEKEAEFIEPENDSSEQCPEPSSEIAPQESYVPTDINFSKSYSWEDDNLKGSVKRMEETFISTDGFSSWFIAKEYDTSGRICYFKRDGTDHNVLSTVFPKGFPNTNQVGGMKYSAFEEYGRYLNPVHMLGYNASNNRRYFEDGVFTFEYNDKGLINNVYYNNKLVNKCEYDEYGRLTTRYEDGLPTLKILWDSNADSATRVSFEIRLYNADGNPMKSIVGKWNDNILKIEDNGYANPREYTFVGQNLMDYKANRDGYGYQYEYFTLSNINNTLEITEYAVLNRKHYIRKHYIHKYNEEGNLSEYIVSQDDKIVTHFKWSYIYDENKNWTSATQYKVIIGEDITFEEKLETITRKYEYYE